MPGRFSRGAGKSHARPISPRGGADATALDRRSAGPHADHPDPPQAHRHRRRGPALRHLREQPVRDDLQGPPARVRVRRRHPETGAGLGLRGPVPRRAGAGAGGRPDRPTAGLPDQPGAVLRVLAARCLLPERRVADRHPIPGRHRHRRRTGALRLLLGRRTACGEARQVHRVGVHHRVLRRAGRGLRRPVAGTAHPARDRRLALAVRPGLAGFGRGVGAAAAVDRVAALARLGGPARRGRAAGRPAGRAGPPGTP